MTQQQQQPTVEQLQVQAQIDKEFFMGAIESLKQDLAEMADKKAVANSQLGQYQGIVKVLQEQLKEANEAKAVLEEQVGQARHENEVLTEELTNLQTTLKELEETKPKEVRRAKK